MRHRITLAALSVAAVTALTALAPAAGAAPAGQPDRSPATTGHGNPGPAYWAKQQRVTNVADAITNAYRAIPGDSGFGGLITDPEKSGVTLYWHGKLPASVAAATKVDARVKVTVTPARYTQRQLVAARDTVIAKRKQVPGATVVSASPNGDGSGLRVGVDTDAAQVRSEAVAPLSAKISAVAGDIPVTLSAEKPERSIAAPSQQGPSVKSRHDQQAYGGARWRTSSGGGCSEGFSLGWSRDSAMVTAAHCAQNGTDASSPSGGRFGTVIHRDTSRDVEVIRPANAGDPGFFQPYMWWGDTNGQGLWPVRGWVRNYQGNLTCSSGAYSGTICNIKIVANQTTHCYEEFCPSDLIDVRTTDGSAVWGQGDSGGPISSPAGLNIWANGMISGSDKRNYGAPCKGEQNRLCASFGWYAPIDNFLESSGFRLNVT